MFEGYENFQRSKHYFYPMVLKSSPVMHSCVRAWFLICVNVHARVVGASVNVHLDVYPHFGIKVKRVPPLLT